MISKAEQPAPVLSAQALKRLVTLTVDVAG